MIAPVYRHVWAFADPTIWGDRDRLIEAMQRQLANERKRVGSWTYDPARHASMIRQFKTVQGEK